MRLFKKYEALPKKQSRLQERIMSQKQTQLILTYFLEIADEVLLFHDSRTKLHEVARHQLYNGELDLVDVVCRYKLLF